MEQNKNWIEKLGKRKRVKYETEEERLEAKRAAWRRASAKSYEKKKEARKNA